MQSPSHKAHISVPLEQWLPLEDGQLIKALIQARNAPSLYTMNQAGLLRHESLDSYLQSGSVI